MSVLAPPARLALEYHAAMPAASFSVLSGMARPSPDTMTCEPAPFLMCIHTSSFRALRTRLSFCIGLRPTKIVNPSDDVNERGGIGAEPSF